MKRAKWFSVGITLVIVGLVCLALPDVFEGREILVISPGHALSILDAFALVPLVFGASLLEYGIWRQRREVMQIWINNPASGAGVCFGAGIGLGLLLASVFSSFSLWWALGALIFGVFLLRVSLLAA